MSRLTRVRYGAFAIICLSAGPFPAMAQTAPYKYGFCLGIAGTPPVNQITRAFALATTGPDLRAAFMQSLGKKYGGNVRRDATGCRMFATGPEAERAYDQVLAQVRGKPLVELDWLPESASALKATAPPRAEGTIESSTPHTP